MGEIARWIESWLSGHDVVYLDERILPSCFSTYVPFARRLKWGWPASAKIKRGKRETDKINVGVANLSNASDPVIKESDV
jgi:hypothetical protein